HSMYEGMPAGLLGNLALAQASVEVSVAKLWLLTCGARQVGEADTVPHPLQATSWGLGRTLALEHPETWGGLVDLPDELDEETGDRLVAGLGGGGGEDQVALRGTDRFVRRLVRDERSGGYQAEPWNTHGTVLITGGTGSLGA